MSDYSGTGTVIQRVGFTLVRNDHHQRIVAYCADSDADALQLLGLYLHMAAKPHGWRFSAERLARELGTGRDKIRRVLRHLADLGYYQVITVRDDSGRTTRTAVFDAGTVGPEVTTTPSTKDGFSVVGPTSGNDANPQVAPKTGKPTFGEPTFGEPVVSVSTHQPVLISQSVNAPEPPTGGDDVTDLTAVMDMLDPRIRPTPTRQLAEYLRWATQRGWHADQLRDHITRNVNADRAGPGAVVALIKNLGTPPNDLPAPISEADRHPSSTNLTGLAERQAAQRARRSA